MVEEFTFTYEEKQKLAAQTAEILTEEIGLKGDAIPVEARIMAVADVYDALVSSRCYKDSMSYDKAGEIILAGMGTQFDPILQKYFMDCEAKLREYYRTVEH